MTKVDAIDRETVYKLLAEKVPSPYYEDIFKAIYDLPPVSSNERKESEFRRQMRLSRGESCYLDQGITQC